MKIIIVAGPSNAGKDAVIDFMLEELNKENPGSVSKSRYFTTRKEDRSGEVKDEYFLTDEKFNEKVKKGEIVFKGLNSDYQVGYSAKEFEKTENVLVNIASKFVKPFKKYVKEKGGHTFSIFLWAPREVRVQRHMRREGYVIYEPSEFKVDNDITTETLESAQGYDLKLENSEGEFEKTMEQIMPKVKEFLAK